MRGIYFDFKLWKVLLKKLHLNGKYGMLVYKKDWEIPKLRYSYQVRVKTLLGGICKSDIRIIDVDMSYYTSIIANKEIIKSFLRKAIEFFK